MATEAQDRASKQNLQNARRARQMNLGYSSDCVRSAHERCRLDGCPCKCHREVLGVERTSRPTTGETAPKRPDVKTGVKAAVPAPVARQIKSEFAVLLWGLDQGAAKFVPRYWTTPDDRLQDDERTSLVNATYNELEARCPQVLKWLQVAQNSAPEAALLYTLAMIAAPRLARHGVITPELASAITFAPLILQQLQQSVAEQSAAVGTEPAPQPDRANGYGEVDVSGVPPAGETLQVGVAEQTGFGDIRHGSSSPNGASNHGHPL